MASIELANKGYGTGQVKCQLILSVLYDFYMNWKVHFLDRDSGLWQRISVQSMMTLVDGYLSLKSAGMCWLTLALDGHTGILQNFKKHKITHKMVIRPTIVCEIPYRWLKCSSLNPCLNLQRVKNILPLGLNCLGLPCFGASSSHLWLLTVAESSECQ